MIRIFALALSLFWISNVNFSQSLEDISEGTGVYKTHADFLNNKLTYYGKYISYINISNSFSLVFKDTNGERRKIKISKGSMWGYKDNHGRVYRIDAKAHPCRIMVYGAIVIHGEHRESGQTFVETTRTGSGFTTQSESTKYQLSFGTNGQMGFYNRDTIKKEKES